MRSVASDDRAPPCVRQPPPHTWDMATRRKLKPNSKTETSRPPAQPPKTLASDPAVEIVAAINRAVIAINGAVDIAASTLQHQIDTDSRSSNEH